MFNIAITAPVEPIWNIIDSSPTGGGRAPLPSAPFNPKVFPQKLLIEISIYPMTNSRNLASLLCGSGKVR